MSPFKFWLRRGFMRGDFRMKKIAVLMLLLASGFVFPGLATAAKKPAPKPAAAKQAAGKPAAHARGRGAAAKPAARGAVVRDKRGRIIRRAPPPPPMVQGAGAATPVDASPGEGKIVPARAYAADARSFYHNGRKVRIVGLREGWPAGNELAKQRLQKALDSGELNVTPQGVDESGDVLANVRVGGRDITELLRGE